MGLQEIVDKVLLEKQEKRSGKGSGKWKPSMMGRCYRSHYWARMDEPLTNPPDTRTLRIFADTLIVLLVVSTYTEILLTLE